MLKKKTISIGIPVMNQHKETIRCLKQLGETTSIIEEIFIIDNGSSPTFMDALYEAGLDNSIINKINPKRFSENIGVRPALNEIWKRNTSDILVFTHNDVEFLEKDWDKKVLNAFKQHPYAGIIGAYGAKRIGTEDIYHTPYLMQQLARGGNVSDCLMDKEVHGFRNLENEFENVAVFDGFFMAIKKNLLDRTQGFSDILPSHHNYDNLICIQSLEKGFENIVIPLKLNHLGGRTDVGEDWTKGTGKTKQQVHEDAHPPLYEYGRGKLPILVEDIYDENYKVCGYNLYMNHQLIKTKIYD
jgi:glycosyltransferase involved in cell wall biosynthesis